MEIQGKFWVFGLVLFLTSIPTAVAQEEIAECIVTDFANNEIMYAYTGSTTAFTNTRQNAVIKVSVDNAGSDEDVTPLYSIDKTANADTNYEQECWTNLKMCKAKIGIFEEASVRQNLFGGSTNVIGGTSHKIKMAATAGGTYQECFVVGRILNFVNSTLYETASLADDSYVFNAGGIDGEGNFLGVSQEPDSVTPRLDGNNMTGLQVTYSGSGNNVASFGATSGGVLGSSIAFQHRLVATVTVYYDANDGTETVCGLRLQNSGGGDLVNQGCDTNPRIFPISSGRAFAGFAGYSSPSQSAYLIEPLEYQRMQPMIYYYERTHESVTVHVNSFWPLAGTLSYSYTAVNGVNTANSAATESSSTVGTAGSGGGLGDISFSIPTECGCIPVTVTVNTEYSPADANDFIYVTGMAGQIKAWSVGYEIAGTNSTSSVTTTTSYTSSSRYYVGTVEECPDIHPMSYLSDAQGGELFLDGLLGTTTSALSVALTSSDFQDITKPINQVVVYFSGNTVQGLELRWDINVTHTIGTASGDSQVLGSPDANGILLYLSINDLTGGGQSVTATFGRPIGPCVFWKAQVEDVNGEWKNGGGHFTIGNDADADQYQFWLYLPLAYTSLHAELTGYLLVNDEMYNLTLSDGGFPFNKTQIVHAYFYHLQAEQYYNVDFFGNMDNLFGYADADLQSTRTNDSFTTPHGVRYLCDENGQSYEQIEYEALPDVEIIFDVTAEATQLTSTPTGMLNSSVGTSMEDTYFPNTDYFYFDTNDNAYPKFDNFIGYPRLVRIYHLSGESCIKGLAFVYSNANGVDVTQWVAGRADFTDVNLVESNITIGENLIESINGDTATQGLFDCLENIQFVYSTGGSSNCRGLVTSGNACPGAPTLVTNTGFRSNSYLYGVSVSTDSSGDYIYRLKGHYAAVDLPSLQSSGACVLTREEDYNYIRNTIWWRRVDFNSSAGGDFGDCLIQQEVYPDNQTDIATITDQRDPQFPTDKHEIMYHQKVVRSRDSASNIINDTTGGGLSIVRQNTWQVNLFCYYDASGQVSSQFDTKAEDAKSAYGTNEFDFDLVIYRNSDYTSPYSSSEVPILLLNEPVYMAVTMVEPNGQSNFFVKGLDCWGSTAVTTTRVANSYYLLSNIDGCYEDTTFRWENDSNIRGFEKDPFHFNAFAWYSNNNILETTVHIQCHVRACVFGNDGGFCDRDNENQPCTNQNRQRRDLSYLKRNGQNFETLIAAANPIIIRRQRDVQDLAIARGPGGKRVLSAEGSQGARMAAGTMSLFATVMLCSMVVIMYKAYKLRHNYKIVRGYMNKQNNNKEEN